VPLVEVQTSSLSAKTREVASIWYCERLTQAAREVCFDLLHVHLTCRQAEIVNLGHCCVRVFANADDQPSAAASCLRWRILEQLVRAELRGCIVRTNTVSVVASIEISPAARNARRSLKKGSTIPLARSVHSNAPIAAS